jgi:hypothetical protein
VWFDKFNVFLSIVLFLNYSIICIISLIFTFSLKTYLKIDEQLNFDIFSSPTVNPLDRNIDWFNDWLIANNKIVGPVFIYLSIISLKSWFDILNTF